MTAKPPAAGPLESPLQEGSGLLGGVSRRVSRWRARRKTSPGWTVCVAFILAIMAVPIAAVVSLAATSADNVWPHLVSTVLPRSFAATLWLAFGTGILTLAVGTGTAWLVTMYRFPCRGLLDRLLVIPLAVPTYISAYCYGEVFDYAGPLQSALRSLFGWSSAHEYWFPDIRSSGGAIFVFSAVFYPYVYLAARASFVQQSVCALEVARTLGRTAMGAFWTIALPMARPALAAGTALVVMECFNDLGAVQYLGVATLSASIYSTWLQRSSLGGAAQLATVMLLLIVCMFALERIARGGAKIHHTTGRYRAIPFEDIKGWQGYAVAGLCMLPFVAGFVVPFFVLVTESIRHGHKAIEGGFLAAAWNSLLLASLATSVAVALALIVTYARRVAGNGFTKPAVRIAGLGYALPGAVLAIGILIPLAALDNWIDAVSRSVVGISTGLLISGSMLALVYAYVIRFLGVAVGGIEAGLERVSPNLDAAARALGESAMSALWRVHLPLLLPSIGAAGLLVFVDSLKELPATLLLRPFNFETLSTHVYNFAALEQIESGALGALSIVLAGLLPLAVLHGAIAGGRAGGHKH